MERIKRLHDEHKDIRSLLEQLGAVMEVPTEADQTAFIGLLQQLLEDLGLHFAFEENDGLFEDITQQRPCLDRKIAQLLRQHIDLMAEFKAVLALAKTCNCVSEVAPPLREAIAGLRMHERLETDLVQDAMLTDIGGRD